MKPVGGLNQGYYKDKISLFLEFIWRERWTWFAVLVMTIFYGFIVSVVRGNGEWIYVDEVGGNNFYWGDDAYRWFIARSAWIKPEIYWFNFTLPVWVFLEGILVTLSQHDLLHARYIKAALTAISVILVYKTSIKLGLVQWASVTGAFLLATMPMYIFMGMSFYGESWLAFLIAASMYCYVHEHKKLFLLIMTIMPLVRPEGLFFVIGFTAIFLYQRKWRYIPVLFFCGGLFFVSIFIFSEPSAFSGWRTEASKVYQAQGKFYGWGGRDLFDVFAFPLAIPALIGMLMPRSRLLYGFYIGMLLVIYKWGVDFSENKAFFESRYFSPVMPIVILGFVIFLDNIYGSLKRNNFSPRKAYFLLLTLAALVFGCHVYSLTTLRTAFLDGIKDGTPFRYLSTNWEEGGRLYGLSLEEKVYFKEYADVVIKMLRLNPDIKTLLVGNIQVFYFLEPKLIPDHVRVVFSPFARSHLKDIFTETKASGYFAEPPYYGYFNLVNPTYEKDKILYLDHFPYEDYPYQWRVGGSKMAGPNDIFLFGGHFLGMKNGEATK